MTGPRSPVIALVPLDRRARTSLREQVYAGLRDSIVGGRIARGALLPSTRALASELHISRNTIVAAFDQLIAEGYVHGRPGAGSYVSEHLPDELIAAPPVAAARPTETRGRISPERTIGHAFSMGIPAIDEFPYDVWRRLVVKRWRRPGSLAGYAPPAGLEALRETIAGYARSARGVRCHADQVIVVGGALHGLDLTARVVLNASHAVWVEDPGYIAAQRALASTGARLVTVGVDRDGIDVHAGRAAAPRPRLIYVTPSGQFPLGVTMSMDRRRALLDAADAANAWILEDDYDCEFRYAGRALPSLQGIDRESRVIYVGSFSKGLLPGLRLAYVIAPPALLDRYHNARATSGSQPSLSDQAVVADFMREGYFARHIRRMRELYRARRECLLATARTELGDAVHIDAPDAGTHVIAFLPPDVDDTRVSAAAAQRGVVALPLSRQYVAARPRSGLLLGYGGVREPLITRAVQGLAAALGESTRIERAQRTAS